MPEQNLYISAWRAKPTKLSNIKTLLNTFIAARDKMYLLFLTELSNLRTDKNNATYYIYH